MMMYEMQSDDEMFLYELSIREENDGYDEYIYQVKLDRKFYKNNEKACIDENIISISYQNQKYKQEGRFIIIDERYLYVYTHFRKSDLYRKQLINPRLQNEICMRKSLFARCLLVI